jgi:hypothetical protein
MNEHDIEVEEGFYHAVARLLECKGHVYSKFPYSKRNRWNHRQPGNGRYPNHGIVRRFGPRAIHVQLNEPRIHGRFSSARAALDAIETAMKPLHDQLILSAGAQHKVLLEEQHLG